VKRERDTFDDSIDEVRELIASADLEEDAEDIESRGAALLGNRRQLVSLVLAVVLMVVAIYVVFPKLVGVGDALGKLGDAHWYWLVLALTFNVVRFLAYSALFRGVLSGEGRDEAETYGRLDLKASYQITMAGFAATILFSAAGAGGVALTYWALRKAGMERRRAACRMVAFMVVLYAVYLMSLVVFGVLLRTGVLSGEEPVAGTIVPAAVAAGVLAILGLVALVPGDFERRLAALRRRRRLQALATGPATLATGVRTALDYIRHPARSASAIVGAVGWWSGNIGILWASFHAFDVSVPFGVVVQGYFLGMVANLAPSPAAGVGTVDAGLIGAFVLFGIPAETVFPAILIFRLVAFWLPIPLGVWAYVQLRHTVQRWSEEDSGATIQSEVTARAT
jgi:uncharacterized protein (TIRG00374 family)